MAEKKTYWLTDGYGAKARVVGADQRDQWVPLGWSEAGEPAAGDMVWLRHVDHGGRAKFPAEVVELWQAKGWEPSDPPAPDSPFNATAPADAVDTPAPAAPVVEPKTSSKEK